MKFSRIVTIFSLLFVSVLAASAQLSMKTYELEYRNNSTAYMYAGIKGTVRLTNIPYDADYIQIVIVNNPKAPKARLIGTRNIEVLKGNSNIAEFVIELDEIEQHLPFTTSLELKIKTFTKINGEYEISDKISMYVRPIVCTGQDDEVCGLVKTKCHSGNASCIEREIARTFKSNCEADSYGADVLHAGPCAGE